MPFVFVTAPPTFQRLMDKVLHGYNEFSGISRQLPDTQPNLGRTFLKCSKAARLHAVELSSYQEQEANGQQLIPQVKSNRVFVRGQTSPATLTPNLQHLLLLAGDIETNPGPPKKQWNCAICKRIITRATYSYQCNKCQTKMGTRKMQLSDMLTPVQQNMGLQHLPTTITSSATQSNSATPCHTTTCR